MNENNTHIMQEEINRRKESNDWNFRMAQSVLARRNSRKKKALFTSMAAAAAAAAVSIVLLFGLREEAVQQDYNSFISSQVTGTYHLVFNGNSKEHASSEEALLLSDDLDTMISNVMSMR